jgi:hypothetical protein
MPYAQHLAVLGAISDTDFPTKSGSFTTTHDYYIMGGTGYIQTSINFTAAGQYRVDLTGHGSQSGALWPTIDVKVGGATKATITMSNKNPDIWSVFINVTSTGTQTFRLEWTNYNGGASFKASLAIVYVTLDSSAVPLPVKYQPIDRTQCPVIGQYIRSDHFASGHIRGFNLGPHYDIPEADIQLLAQIKANLFGIYLRVVKNAAGTTYVFDTGVLAAADTYVAWAQKYNILIRFVLEIEPHTPEDFWGIKSLEDSLIDRWRDLATQFNTNPYVACFSFGNEVNADTHMANYMRMIIAMAKAVRAIDSNRCILAPYPLTNNFFLVTQAIPFDNVVYEYHSYGPFEVTHQGVTSACSSCTVRTDYPNVVGGQFYNSSLGPYGYNELSNDLVNVRYFANRWNSPILVGEFSATLWGPNYSSEHYLADSTDLFEKEQWAWLWHSWRQYQPWEAEISPDTWYQYPYNNTGAPLVNGGTNYSSVDAARNINTRSMQIMKSYFAKNACSAVDPNPTGYSLVHKGYFGMSTPDAAVISSLKPEIKGYFIRDVLWSALQPAELTYDWTVLDNLVKICVDAGIIFVVAVRAGPDAPAWLYSSKGVPKVTMKNGDPNGPQSFPFYLNTNYKLYYERMIEAVNAHMAAWPATWKAKMSAWESLEGWSTNFGPYNGIPTVTTYNITTDQWDTLLKELRLHFYQTNSIALSVFNPDNDGRLFDWQRDNCPKAAMHSFALGRRFGDTAEHAVFTRSTPPAFYRTECEDTPKQAYWSNQVLMAIVASCLNADMSIFCINQADVNKEILGIFNEQAGSANNGFIYMRMQVDLADTNQYPEVTYGDLIDPARITPYTDAVDNYTIAYGANPNYLKYLLEGLKNTYLNPARATSIRNLMTPLGATWAPGDLRNHNYGVMLDPGAYSRNLGLPNANTFKPGWRIGDPSQPYGLYALTFPTGTNEFFIRKLDTMTLLASNIIRITYFDGPSGCWAPSWDQGSGVVTQPFVNLANTGQWITKYYPVKGLMATGVGGQYIMSIKRCGTSDVWFAMIRIIAEQSPPVANAGLDIAITQPASSATLNGSLSSDPNGTITRYSWSVIGTPPAIPAIASPSSATTGVSRLTAVGHYTFQLEVEDNAFNLDRDTIDVNVSAGKPVVDAGPNQTITLPTNSVVLDGSKSTPTSGTITGYAWSQTAGPSTATIINSTQAITSVTGLIAGTYTFKLIVTNAYGLSDNDSITIIVNPALNQPPVAEAGNNQTITLPVDMVTVDASASTAGAGETIISYLWTKLTGGVAAITTPDAASTTLTGLAQGVYTFQVLVTNNNNLTSTDTVTVTVNAAIVNNPPIADAGTNQTITLPTNTVTLTSAASSDPGGSITSRQWSVQSGPAGAVIQSPTAIQTVVSGLIEGAYIFKVVVTDDGGLTSSDTVTITVLPKPNVPPVANAGANVTIIQPASTATLSGSGSTDPDGSIVAYLWTQLAGAPATITTPTNISTTVTGLAAGNYTFQLQVTDNNGAAATDAVDVIVQIPLVPPTSCAGSSKTLTLPQSSTSIGCADTTGTNPIALISWTVIAKPAGASPVIGSPSSAITNVSALTVVGDYTFRKLVGDNSTPQLTDTDSVTITVKQAIPVIMKYGFYSISTETLDNEIKVAKQMGITHFRPGFEVLTTYVKGTGSGPYNKCKAAGLKMIHTLCWNETNSPNAMFCHDQALYKQQLNKVLDDYAADNTVVEVLVIENKPDSVSNYGDTVANYITQLGWAIDVCHVRTPKILVADGGVHIASVMGLRNGGTGGRADQVLTGINDLKIAGKVLDFVTLYTNISLSTDARSFIAAADEVRKRSGIQKVLADSWWQVETGSAKAIQAIRDMRTGNFYYCVMLSGECPWVSGKPNPLACHMNLTSLGKDIKAEIARG